MRESKKIRERKNPEGNQDQNVFLRRKKKRRKDYLSAVFLGFSA